MINRGVNLLHLFQETMPNKEERLLTLHTIMSRENDTPLYFLEETLQGGTTQKSRKYFQIIMIYACN